MYSTSRSATILIFSTAHRGWWWWRRRRKREERNPTALKSARQPSRKMNSPSREGLESGFLLRDRTLSSGKLYPHRCPRESGRIYLVLRPRSCCSDTRRQIFRRDAFVRSSEMKLDSFYIYTSFLRFALHLRSIIDFRSTIRRMLDGGTRKILW